MQFVRTCFLSQQIKDWYLHKWASCLDDLCCVANLLLFYWNKYFPEEVSLKGIASARSSFMQKSGF